VRVPFAPRGGHHPECNAVTTLVRNERFTAWTHPPFFPCDRPARSL